MWTLTGFADEISDDFGEQLSLLQELGVTHLEFRSAWGTNILLLSPDQLERAKQMLDQAGIKVSSIGSPIGKILVDEDFDEHLEAMRHAVEVAKFFGAPYIRLFSFFIPEGSDPDSHRDEVLRRMKAIAEVAEGSGVTLLHENEKDIYGDSPERVVDLITEMDSPHYRGIFDPANYVQCGAKPFDEAYPLVKDFTHYLHVKDASATEFDANGHSKVVPAGHGDGQFPELIAALKADGYEGFLSIEPHLGDFNAFGGLCGPDLWTDAFNAITKILSDQDIAWQ